MSDINEIINGLSVFAGQPEADPDLKEVIFKNNDTIPSVLSGGYRVISSVLAGGILVNDAQGTLRGISSESKVGIAKINLQTNNYNEGMSNGRPRASFPVDEAVDYGKVTNARDMLRVYPGALVLGSLQKAVTAAIKWRNSDRYLLLPYVANIFEVSSQHRRYETEDGYHNGDMRWVTMSTPNICLGGIKSGNLSDWAFNGDLRLGYQADRVAPCPPGFLPVFVPQYGLDQLRQLQDKELARMLVAFMPGRIGDFNSVKTVLTQADPRIAEVVETYDDGRGYLPDFYTTEGLYNKVYALYTRIFAETFLKIWGSAVRPH